MQKKEFNEIERLPLSPVQTLVCGFAGIMMPKAALAPFDSLKLYTQLYGADSKKKLMHQVKIQGFPCLYNGVLCDCIRIPTRSVLHYMLFNQMRNRMNLIAADCIADAISSAAFHPLEVVQALMISDSEKYSTIAKTVSKVLKRDGTKGLFRGLTPTLIGFIPYRSVQLGANFILKKYPIKNTPINKCLVTGSVTGLAQFCTYPFDNIRKRMVCDESLRGLSMLEVMKKTKEEKGLRGFFDGFGVSVVKSIPLIWLQGVATNEITKFIGRFNYLMDKHQFK